MTAEQCSKLNARVDAIETLALEFAKASPHVEQIREKLSFHAAMTKDAWGYTPLTAEQIDEQMEPLMRLIKALGA
jgi:hypothetical protein